MSESTTPCHDPLDLEENDCRRFAAIIGLILVALAGLTSCMKSFLDTQTPTEAAIEVLHRGITAFKIDSAHFPIPESDWHGPDVLLRTRGTILPALLV